MAYEAGAGCLSHVLPLMYLFDIQSSSPIRVLDCLLVGGDGDGDGGGGGS